MFVVINPLILEEVSHKVLLRTLLTSNKLCLYWGRDQTFLLLYEGAIYEVKLTHSIVLGNPVEDGFTYRVISNDQLADGSYSAVHPVECTLSISDEHRIEYSQQNMLVVKIQTFPLGYSLPHIKGFGLREYHFANMTKHLRMEPPKLGLNAQRQYLSFLCMNLISGVELFDIISAHCRYHINSDLLMEITLATLTAYQEQVLDCGIMMHLDVKPENILVDLGLSKTTLSTVAHPDFSPEKLVVRFIDYTFCLLPNGRLGEPKGTRKYMAPEIKALEQSTMFTDEKPDIYSLGVSLMALWFKDKQVPFQDSPDCSEMLDKLYNSLYAKETFSFSKEKLIAIHDVISRMTEEEPLERWSLNQAIEGFRSIAEMRIAMDEAIPSIPRVSSMSIFKPLTRSLSSTVVVDGIEQERSDLMQELPEAKRAR